MVADREVLHGSPGDRVWAGSVRLAPGMLAFNGRIGDADAHTHACLQVLIVTAGQVALHDRQGNRQLVTNTAIIPAGVRHQVIASPDAEGLAAYLDADSRAGRAAAARVSARGDNAHSGSWVAVAAHPERPIENPAARDHHPALAEAVRRATANAGGPPDLVTLSAMVSLSPSRLGHLFAEHLGLSYPAWRRWVRLQHAMTAVRDGVNLSGAAHAAGFADSAHLTRTFRAMFGITPTRAVQASGWRIS